MFVEVINQTHLINLIMLFLTAVCGRKLGAFSLFRLKAFGRMSLTCKAAHRAMLESANFWRSQYEGYGYPVRVRGSYRTHLMRRASKAIQVMNKAADKRSKTGTMVHVKSRIAMALKTGICNAFDVKYIDPRDEKRGQYVELSTDDIQRLDMHVKKLAMEKAIEAFLKAQEKVIQNVARAKAALFNHLNWK
jgi:ribosomal protein L31E